MYPRDEEMDEVKNLIDILLDKKRGLEERDNAAMDLEAYCEKRVLDALVKAATQYAEDPILLETCGESIAVIWLRLNTFDLDIFLKLHPIAQQAIRSCALPMKPEWFNKK